MFFNMPATNKCPYPLPWKSYLRSMPFELDNVPPFLSFSRSQAICFAISSTKVFLKIQSHVLTIVSCSCLLALLSIIPPLRSSPLHSSSRLLRSWALLAAFTLQGPLRARPLRTARTTQRIFRLRAMAESFQDPPLHCVHFFNRQRRRTTKCRSTCRPTNHPIVSAALPSVVRRVAPLITRCIRYVFFVTEFCRSTLASVSSCVASKYLASILSELPSKATTANSAPSGPAFDSTWQALVSLPQVFSPAEKSASSLDGRLPWLPPLCGGRCLGFHFL
jgi:hypothetical protein